MGLVRISARTHHGFTSKRRKRGNAEFAETAEECAFCGTNRWELHPRTQFVAITLRVMGLELPSTFRGA